MTIIKLLNKLIKLLIIFLWLFLQNVNAQSVGLVLSGGGARGLAHIGVLKALEENNIPIDYLIGTSSGALVGSFYVSGYSPKEIELMVKSEYFLTMVFGQIDKKKFYNATSENDASILKIPFYNKISIRKAIPINVINSSVLDFELMTMFSSVSKVVQYNFDNLFIPYRCISTNLSQKKSEILTSGFLNEAVRASIAFPGYIKPIKINNDLMVDGGLTNYFPINIMHENFTPDIVIGVKISDSLNSLYEEDALVQLNQIKKIVINEKVPIVKDINNIIISPEVSIGTFNFQKANFAIKKGYDAAMKSMDVIKSRVSRRVSLDSLVLKRQIFRSKITQLSKKINLITIEGVSNNQAHYIKNYLIHKNESEIDFLTLRKRFFKLLANEKIKSLYPLATYNNMSNKYEVKINVILNKPFVMKLGGVISSRPINTIYLGLEYLKAGKIGLKINSDIYFGKYYRSSGVGIQADFNNQRPFYIKAYGILNNWDYFRNSTTFVDAVRPSYFIQNESFYGGEIGFPIGKQFKLSLNSSFGCNKDSYYQTDNFSASDTADITYFHVNVSSVNFTSSTLNRKAYSSEGRLLAVSGKYIIGKENYYPGNTTSATEDRLNIPHYNFKLKVHFEQYISLYKNIKLGFEIEAVNSWRNQFFGNYTSTILNAPIYQPFPEAKTHFIRAHVSHSYLGLGAKIVVPIKAKIDFRGEFYILRPSVLIQRTNQNKASYNYNITSLDYRCIAGVKVVYHSLIGPLMFGVNYYDAQPNSPWLFSLNYGYILFNKRFIK